MKDSGVKWIEQIPEDWSLIRFKDKYINRKEIAGKNSTDYERLALTLNGVIKRPKDDSEGLQPKEFDCYQIIYENDFVFKMIDLQNISTSRVGLSPYTGLVSPAYIRFSPRIEGQYNKFVYYFLMSMYYNCVYNNLAGNGVRSALNATDMGQFVIPYPSINIQRKIVNLLENKLTQMDNLIANQQAQIEKLKEYKQSVITEAVTKGLDSTAPMKDSGVEWIGKIKISNNVYRLKFALKSPLLYGANESGDVHYQAVRYIRITDITNDNQLKDDDNNQYLTEQQAQGYILSHNDVLFARSGGTVGKTFIFNEKYGRCAFAGYLIKAECNKNILLPKFLMYYTQSSLYDIWRSMIFIQSTIQNIGANKYANLEIILPPIREQVAVVDYLDKKCANIDNLISIKQQKIEKLQEYKKSLIYEYVTGKKEVV